MSTQLEYIIRPMKQEEYPLLEDFLYEAIFIPPSYKEEVPRSVIYQPQLWRTIDRFGELADDYCLVAEADGKVVGAVWVRIADQYGHLDDETPSFSISLYKEYRNHGIGTKMMQEMLQYLRKQNYERASLSVQKENYAVRMYRAVGFETIGENEEEYIMICPLRHWSYCGDDCLKCPRYLAKTEEELQEVAELWYRVGWRDTIPSPEEMRCSGCNADKNCSYGLIECIRRHGVNKCSACPNQGCEKVEQILDKSDRYEEECRNLCTDEEFRSLAESFFNKRDSGQLIKNQEGLL